jgi:hypothetical protein
LFVEYLDSLTIVKRAEINMGIQVSILYIDLYSSGYRTKSGSGS